MVYASEQSGLSEGLMWGVAAAKCVLHSDEPCAQAQDS